jgi:hypothetical protein
MCNVSCGFVVLLVAQPWRRVVSRVDYSSITSFDALHHLVASLARGCLDNELSFNTSAKETGKSAPYADSVLAFANTRSSYRPSSGSKEEEGEPFAHASSRTTRDHLLACSQHRLIRRRDTVPCLRNRRAPGPTLKEPCSSP